MVLWKLAVILRGASIGFRSWLDLPDMSGPCRHHWVFRTNGAVPVR